MEYPGYSVYKSAEISEEIILRDSEIVMDYLLNKCHVDISRVFILGRSLGTGPACCLATKYPAAGLILVSPFTSIKHVASEHYGIFGSLLVKDRFNNLENIKKVKCPTLIIHGQLDKLVPVKHGQTLNGKLCLIEDNCSQRCILVTPETMSHSLTNFSLELRDPIYSFIQAIGFSLMSKSSIVIR